MGFHYINGALLDANVDASHPEVLVYAPDKNGQRKLVALEYVVFQADWIAAHGDTMPTLFGQMFMATGFPNWFAIPAFFSLHIWLYQNNPSGMFAPLQPDRLVRRGNGLGRDERHGDTRCGPSRCFRGRRPALVVPDRVPRRVRR